MTEGDLPGWTMLPFPILVFSIAALPLFAGKLWEKRWFQAVVLLVLALPVVAAVLATGHARELGRTAAEYVAFIATLGALYVAAGGVYASGDLEATPRTNLTFLAVGSLLASLIGTTGASVLVIRPLLRTNSQRQHTAHLVPFFILAVSNAGGLLTPLGDPPLLMGFIEGVPFFWTLHLLPVWALYLGTFCGLFYFIDRRAYAKETSAALGLDRAERSPLSVEGKRNLLWLLAIVGAAFLPEGLREAAMIGIGVASYFSTPRKVHEDNHFTFAPFLEVAMVFAAIFACLLPIEAGLAARAASLPLQRGWQLFWASGALSAVLDNAPTYAAFAALARGLSEGQQDLVAGIAPLKLAAISAGSVVMGATTYIGNGPNLIVKSIAEKRGYTLPSFGRFAVFAFFAMLPAHLVVTAFLAMVER